MLLEGVCQVLLRKHIATCDFPGVGGGGPHTLSPLWIRLAISVVASTF